MKKKINYQLVKAILFSIFGGLSLFFVFLIYQNTMKISQEYTTEFFMFTAAVVLMTLVVCFTWNYVFKILSRAQNQTE